VKKVVALMTQAAALADPGARAPLIQEAGIYRNRAAVGSRIVMVLVLITIALMAFGAHYV